MPFSRLHFNEEMNRLQHDVLTMGTKVEEDLRKSIQAVKDRDETLAREVKQNDAVINAFQVKIEDQTAILMATQQPVARDLRELVAILKTVTDLERIGDYAVHLSKTVIKLKDDPEIPLMDALVPMAETGCEMIRNAVTALLNQDEDLARQTAALDASMDERHRQVVKDTLDFIKKNPDKVQQASRILETSGFLERLGDHATAMCESVVYLVSGEHVELNG